MRKKADKIDLKSNSFKIKKTPQKQLAQSSRSPISKSPGFVSTPLVQMFDPNDLFQKVCCPNCKYLFKIIKNNEIFTNNSPKKKMVKQSVLVQTQDIMFEDLKKLSKLNLQVSDRLGPKMSQSFIFKTRLIKQNFNKSMQMQQNSHVKSSTYQFELRQPTKIQSHRLSQFNFDRKPQISLFEQSKIKSQNKYFQEYKETNQVNRETIQAQLKKQINQQLSDEMPKILSSALRTQHSLRYISQFYTELPKTVQISAVSKMLMHDFQILDSSDLLY